MANNPTSELDATIRGFIYERTQKLSLCDSKHNKHEHKEENDN